MHCDGKCCLKKKLAKEGKEQAPNPRNQKSEQVVNLFCANAKFEVQHFAVQFVPGKYHTYNELGTSSFYHSIFHPPSA